MITTLILFNWLWTFNIRARLCICYHPCNVLRLIPILDFPLLSCFTITRSVRNIWALETKPHSTKTCYILNCKISSFNTVSTTRSGTPFDRFIIVSKRFTMKFHISLIILIPQNFFPNWMRDLHWTFYLRTIWIQANLP